MNLNFKQIFKIIRDGDVASRPNLGQIRGPKSQSGTWIYLPKLFFWIKVSLFIANLAWVNETQEFDSVLKPGTWDILTFQAAIVISNIDSEMFACGSQSG